MVTRELLEGQAVYAGGLRIGLRPVPFSGHGTNFW